MNQISLAEDLYVQVVEPGLTALSAAKYPASAAFIDVYDFERFAFLVGLDVVADDVVFQVEQATAANGTPKDVTGATKTIANATDDQKWFLIEVQTDQLDINNDYHFVTLDVSGISGTNNATIALLGYPKKHPVTSHASQLASVIIAG
ncbi:MAG: hypothetical protein HC804_04550 [Anaerolineae bacterium]|nr:hypothetical protein [Anaerolineae bacterium]